jgi:hypothetical protein
MTISIDLEAYEKLRQARSAPDEPLSQVIKRGIWCARMQTAGGLLSALPGLPIPSEETLAILEARQAADAPPRSAWP